MSEDRLDTWDPLADWSPPCRAQQQQHAFAPEPPSDKQGRARRSINERIRQAPFQIPHACQRDAGARRRRLQVHQIVADAVLVDADELSCRCTDWPHDNYSLPIARARLTAGVYLPRAMRRRLGHDQLAPVEIIGIKF